MTIHKYMLLYCAKCSVVATMICPTCKKLGKQTYYCSNECFKADWAKHRTYHKFTYDAFLDWRPEFRGYINYSGLMRPCKMTTQNTVPDDIIKPDYFTDGIPYSEQDIVPIVQYTPDDIDRSRIVSAMSKQTMNYITPFVQVGITCDALDKLIHDYIVEIGGYPSPLHYRKFPKSCCTSVNEVICHGMPDMYELLNGDLLKIDITIYYDGFHGDMCRTFIVGDGSEMAVRLQQTTEKCLMDTIAKMKPGMLYRDIGNIIGPIAVAEGFSVVRSYCGHGVGKQFHTVPLVPHYARNRAVGVLRPGNIFTIEPMINEGSADDILWPDGWTVTTADGLLSAQYEHTLLVTSSDVEILT